MGRKRTVMQAVGLVALFAGGSLAVPGVASAGGAPVRVLLDDLSSPKGVDTLDSGDPVVGQGAFGAPGPALIYSLRGSSRGEAFPVTDPVNLVDIAISPLDGTGWGLGPGENPEHASLYHQLQDGTIEAVLDITAYQATDPDPVDQEGIPEESNPYGLTVHPSGDALVADAAGNDLIRVAPDGDAVTVARFDVEPISTDHIPGFPVPEITTEAVPTSVTVGPDGAIYVGQLKGFPFRPGTSRVWRIDPDAEGATCSVDPDPPVAPDARCTVYAAGFTGIQDIAFNPTNGRLHVYELAEGGVLAFEEGFETGEFPPAVLLEVKGHKRTELAAGQLTQPGGIAFGLGGQLFATDRVFTDGGGRLLRVAG